MGNPLEQAQQYYREGNTDKAERICRGILSDSPGDPDALHMLGLLALQSGQAGSAIKFIQDAIAVESDNAVFHCNLGLALQILGDINNAVKSLKQALVLNPVFILAHQSIAALYQQLGQTGFAISHFQSVLDLQPDSHQALFHLAGLYYQSGDPGRALDFYNRLLQVAPDNAGTLNNVGVIFDAEGDYYKAISYYQRSVAAMPDYVAAHKNLGTAYVRVNRIKEASESFERVRVLEPDNPLSDLRAASICRIVAASNNEIDQYRTFLLNKLNHYAEKGLSATPEELVQSGVYPSYSLMYHGRNDRPVREAFARVFSPCFPALDSRKSSNKRKIGFVVTRSHEGIFIRSMRGVLQRMNPDKFMLVVVCQIGHKTEMDTHLECEHVLVKEMPDLIEQIVEFIRLERFDLLYYWEIGTDALNYYLPYYRLAPVQCTSWGIQVTSGIPNIDFYLSSKLVEADQADTHYTETLVRADTLLTFQERSTLPESRKYRSDFGLKSGQHIYMYAQQIGKFHPDFDFVVGEILRRDPDGFLIILSDRWGYLDQKLGQRLKRTIPDVYERIIFLPRQDHLDYLCLIAESDVILDPPYYGGVNSSYDCFSLNKPIIAHESQFHISRYAAACYRKMGVMDCLVSSLDNYIEVAVKVGANADFREYVGGRIRESSDALFMDAMSVSEHERIFEELIEMSEE